MLNIGAIEKTVLSTRAQATSSLKKKKDFDPEKGSL